MYAEENGLSHVSQRQSDGGLEQNLRTSKINKNMHT